MYEKQIESLNPWFYEIEVYGHKVVPGIGSPMDLESLLNRQWGRYILLVNELTKRYDFNGKRILDVACNCGYWSGIYITEYGADSVLGIDGRQLFLQQADMYYNSMGIRDKAMFMHANVESIDYNALSGAPFDFVMCAGILYHVIDYRSLLEKISKINTEVMVVDTRVAVKDSFKKEPGDVCFNAIKESRAKTIPGINQLKSLLIKLGYDIEVIPSSFKSVRGLQDGDDYNNGRRICILCRKR